MRGSVISRMGAGSVFSGVALLSALVSGLNWLEFELSYQTPLIHWAILVLSPLLMGIFVFALGSVTRAPKNFLEWLKWTLECGVFYLLIASALGVLRHLSRETVAIEIHLFDFNSAWILLGFPFWIMMGNGFSSSWIRIALLSLGSFFLLRGFEGALAAPFVLIIRYTPVFLIGRFLVNEKSRESSDSIMIRGIVLFFVFVWGVMGWEYSELPLEFVLGLRTRTGFEFILDFGVWLFWVVSITFLAFGGMGWLPKIDRADKGITKFAIFAAASGSLVAVAIDLLGIFRWVIDVSDESVALFSVFAASLFMILPFCIYLYSKAFEKTGDKLFLSYFGSLSLLFLVAVFFHSLNYSLKDEIELPSASGSVLSAPKKRKLLRFDSLRRDSLITLENDSDQVRVIYYLNGLPLSRRIYKLTGRKTIQVPWWVVEKGYNAVAIESLKNE